MVLMVAQIQMMSAIKKKALRKQRAAQSSMNQ
jgi:hypothetical protein